MNHFEKLNKTNARIFLRKILIVYLSIMVYFGVLGDDMGRSAHNECIKGEKDEKVLSGSKIRLY